MSKNDKKNSKPANSVEIVSRLKAFEATYKAACWKQGATPQKALLQQLQQQQEDVVPLKKLLFNGATVDGNNVHAAATALAGYPEVLRWGLWHCNIGDTGLQAVSRLLKSSASPGWRGSRLQHLEIIADGQPDSCVTNPWLVAKAAAAAAAAAPPAKKGKKKTEAAAGAGPAEGGPEGGSGAAGAGDVAGSIRSRPISSLGGVGGAVMCDDASSLSSSGGGGTLSSSLSAAGRRPGRPATAPAGGRRNAAPQALDFPLQLTLAQASLRSRSGDPKNIRHGIAILRTSLEVRRDQLVQTLDKWNSDQAAKGLPSVSRMGVLDPVVVAGVAVTNPLLTEGYYGRAETTPSPQSHLYQQYRPAAGALQAPAAAAAAASQPPHNQQQQQNLQGTQPSSQPQQQAVPDKLPPRYSVAALQCFSLALGVSGLRLTSLVLDHTHLGESALIHLVPGLQRCSNLKVLSLQYCGLGPTAATAIANVLHPQASANTGSYSIGYSISNKAAAAAAAAAVAASSSGAAPRSSTGGVVPILVLPSQAHRESASGSSQPPSSRLAVGSSAADRWQGEAGVPTLAQVTILEDAAESALASTLHRNGTFQAGATHSSSSSSSSSAAANKAPKLQVLQLSGNRLTGVGLSQLAPAIHHAHELKVLALADIGVTLGDTIGLQQLVNALISSCPELHQLDLDLNYIGEAGSSMMLPLLASKPHLQLTKVTSRISRDMAKSLITAMGKNKPAKGKGKAKK